MPHSEDTWEAVLEADADWCLICTYNEWWEGSTIESAVEWGYDYLDLTRQYGRRFKITYSIEVQPIHGTDEVTVNFTHTISDHCHIYHSGYSSSD